MATLIHCRHTQRHAQAPANSREGPRGTSRSAHKTAKTPVNPPANPCVLVVRHHLQFYVGEYRTTTSHCTTPPKCNCAEIRARSGLRAQGSGTTFIFFFPHMHENLFCMREGGGNAFGGPTLSSRTIMVGAFREFVIIR